MNDKKYIDVAKKLIEKSSSRSYTVVSGSMYPLIVKNDKVVCEKTGVDDIKKYSLIAFAADPSSDGVPAVHRVIKIFREKTKIYFKTKGDNNLFADKGFVYPEQIIGSVTEIVKKNHSLRIDKFPNKFLSLASYFLSNVKNFLKSAVSDFSRFFLRENKCEDADGFLIVRQSLTTGIKDWNEITSLNVAIMKDLIDKNDSVCDLSFGGGYCEESFYFIRRGFGIDYKTNEISPRETKKYDFIICSRVINIVRSFEKRARIYEALKMSLKPEGKILLSYINEKNDFLLRFKRKILGSFSKKYDGPECDDIIRKNIFVMKNIPFRTMLRELRNNGFCVLKKIKSGKINTFLISQKKSVS